MRTESPTTILLADDHPIVRQGLAALLNTQPDMRVIGEAGDGIDAVAQAEKFRPHILVADVQMPGLIGLEVVRQLRLRSPRTRAIIFSMHATDTYVIEAFRVGAWGYLLKGADATELIEAIRSVRAGKRFLCKAIPERLHATLDLTSGDSEGTSTDGVAGRGGGKAARTELAAPSAALDPYETLTAREREVLQLAAEGLSNKEAGERLFISFRTVEIHRANALRKLGIHSQTDLIRYAISKGLLPAA